MGVNKNCCFVKPKQDRVCYFCCNTIRKGEKCLSVNPRRGNRRWFCLDCVEELHIGDPLLGDNSWDDGYSSNGL